MGLIFTFDFYKIVSKKPPGERQDENFLFILDKAFLNSYTIVLNKYKEAKWKAVMIIARDKGG
ncbi:MAG: hypothetical protein U5N56_05605 [Candidatus Marinimicrobia bacterium]|nr:hypothetical protein [Candidatus Neomarinimicrobiota bacterium]